MTHMKMRIRFAVGVGAMLAAGMGMVACGGDDTTVGEPSDAGTDGTVVTDGGHLPDGSTDATFDGSSDAGDGSPNGGDSGDASHVFGDAGDGGDDDDGGTGDGGDAAPPTETVLLTTFQSELATTYCTRLAVGCTAKGLGTVNVANCVSVISSGDTPVFLGSTNGYNDPAATSRNDSDLNATYAHLCLSELGAIDFTNVQAPAYKQATQDCFSVVSGTLPAKAGCYESIECASGLYCKKGTYTGSEPDAGDGGDAGPPFTGACSALEADQSDCSSYTAGDSCSYLGIPGAAYCDYDTLNPALPNQICQTKLLATGSTTQCYGDSDCVSGLCDPIAAVCVASTTNEVNHTYCTTYP